MTTFLIDLFSSFKNENSQDVELLSLIFILVSSCSFHLDWRAKFPEWKYYYTVDLLFDLFGLVCFVNKIENFSVVIQLIPNQSNRRSTVR
jgi:hypothetical protein